MKKIVITAKPGMIAAEGSYRGKVIFSVPAQNNAISGMEFVIPVWEVKRVAREAGFTHSRFYFEPRWAGEAL